MLFIDDAETLQFILLLFTRLFNSFPAFRKNLEDPILSCLVNSLKIFKRERDILEQKLGHEAATRLIQQEL
jgi:hypothetical protein